MIAVKFTTKVAYFAICLAFTYTYRFAKASAATAIFTR
jgi:hypothetical protein